MPRPYPDPNFNTTVGMVQHANTLTSGWATVLFAMLIPLVAFSLLRTKGLRTSDSLLVSFFVSFLLTSFMWAASLVQGKVLLIVFLLMMGSGIYSFFDN